MSLFSLIQGHLLKGKINNPRQSRGFCIYGQSPGILACASRRASTICQPRRICYWPPVNGLKNFPSLVVRLLYLPPIDVGYILQSFSHFFLPCLHSSLCTRIHDFYTCTLTLDISRRSSDCFFLLSIP